MFFVIPRICLHALSACTHTSHVWQCLFYRILIEKCKFYFQEGWLLMMYAIIYTHELKLLKCCFILCPWAISEYAAISIKHIWLYRILISSRLMACNSFFCVLFGTSLDLIAKVNMSLACINMFICLCLNFSLQTSLTQWIHDVKS